MSPQQPSPDDVQQSTQQQQSLQNAKWPWQQQQPARPQEFITTSSAKVQGGLVPNAKVGQYGEAVPEANAAEAAAWHWEFEESAETDKPQSLRLASSGQLRNARDHEDQAHSHMRSIYTTWKKAQVLHLVHEDAQ